MLEQDYPDFEVVVVDDGSTDGGANLVRDLNDPRIRLITQPNAGPAAARNRGVDASTHEWILFLDADDRLISEALNCLARHIVQRPDFDFFAGNFIIDTGKEQRPYARVYPEGAVRNPFKSWFFKELMPCQGAYACRRELLQRFPYDKTLRRSEDTHQLFSLFHHARIYRIQTPLMVYQQAYSTESRCRCPIDLDFKGHLDFGGGKSLWERICLYELYVEAKNVYPAEARKLYPKVESNLPLKAAYHAAFRLRAIKRDGTLLRFILVGIANTALGTAVMFLCYNLLNFSYWASSAANYILGSILSYFLNKSFTFRYGKTDLRSIARFIINIAACWLIAYGVAKPLAIKLLAGQTRSIQENVAMAVGMVLFVGLNYFGQKYFAFKRGDKK